ncbi:MAG: hypothetical protein M3141_01645 [Actinomycetota bacterium]|nr:hypothetical protein [Actinomycetota bacterium]
MLKGQDVVVLLELASSETRWTVRSLAEKLHYDVAGVQRATGRLDQAGLYDARRRRVNGSRAEEFLRHSVQYLFPARPSEESRGIPTAWAAAPLASHIAAPSELPPIWPDARGEVRGLALEPLHRCVPAAAQNDPRLWELLALVDALRIGDARIRGVAAQLLSSRIGKFDA